MVQPIKAPRSGQKIVVNKDFSLNVPDEPVMPCIEGDGTGLDITPGMPKVVNAAVAKCDGSKRTIHGTEVSAVVTPRADCFRQPHVPS
jgi:isocitrate dehydrogenase